MAMNPRLMRPLAKTPPGTPASLLLRFNGADASTDFVDSSPNNLTVTATGNAQISTAQSKFGGASGYFDGDGDYLEIAETSALAIGNTWTVEAWVRLNAMPSGTDAWWIADFRASNGSNYTMGVYSTSGLLYAYSNGAEVIGSASLSVEQWEHVAFVNNSGSVSMYLNGVLCGTGTLSHSQGNSGVHIGARHTEAQEFLNGYIDDLRIVPGLAVYDGDFVVPSSQSSSSVVPYTVYKPYGTFLFSECVSGDLVGTYADGVGGRYTEVISVGSC